MGRFSVLCPVLFTFYPIGKAPASISGRQINILLVSCRGISVKPSAHSGFMKKSSSSRLRPVTYLH